jgi:hypothetical protein
MTDLCGEGAAMNLSASPSTSPNPQPSRPQPGPSQERLQALTADLIQAFARIGRRRF